MKKIISALTVLLLFTLLAVSCKSTPSVEEPLPPPPPPPVAIEEPIEQSAEVIEAINLAEQARQRAIDFEAPSYFPSDWEELESRFTAAKQMPSSNQNEINQALASLSDVTESYNELFNKTIPLYAQAREDEIMSVREHLINSGFAAAFPGFLQHADEIALRAYSQYQEEDYYQARETAAEALKEYERLNKGARVYIARQEIIDRDFQKFDTENFERADEVANSAISLYEGGDKEGAENNAEEALLRYNIVLNNGWVAWSSEKRTTASTERELAIAERVNIAMREDFRAADAIFNRAEQEFRDENFHAAAASFLESEALFHVARMETEAKRLRAEETIRLAEERIEASSETAAEAERIIEGGSR